MTDALTALDDVSEDACKIIEEVGKVRTKLVHPSVVQPIASRMTRSYFESVRPELQAVLERTSLLEEIDYVLQAILQLATTAREKDVYLGQINELRPYLMEATIALMKARGASRLVLSGIERGILETLAKMLPPVSASYEQVLRDISRGNRVSWRGTAGELREVLREVIDYLAPDEKVMATPGFQLEEGLKSPTQKQKIRFILRARRKPSTAVTVAEASMTTVDESVAVLARSTYQRGSVSTHTSTDGAEIRNLKRYVDALLAELLEIA